MHFTRWYNGSVLEYEATDALVSEKFNCQQRQNCMNGTLPFNFVYSHRRKPVYYMNRAGLRSAKGPPTALSIVHMSNRYYTFICWLGCL